MREELEEYGRSWARHGYEVRHWTEANLPPLRNQAVYDLIETNGVNTGGGVPELGVWVQRADVVSYELLWRFGGIYANTDVECLKPLDPILDGVEAFCGIEQGEFYCNALMGAVPGHPFLDALLDELFDRYVARTRVGQAMNEVTGPHCLTEYANRFDITVFPQHYFYPYGYLEMDREWDEHPDSYCSHHWNHTRGRWSEEPEWSRSSRPPSPSEQTA